MVGITLVGAGLAVDPGTVQSFTVPKLAILGVGIPVALAVAAASGPVRVGPLGRPLVALIVAVTAATVAGVAPLLSLVGAPFRSTGLLTWLLWAAAAMLGVTVGRQEPVRERIADGFAVVALANAVVASLQRLHIDPFDLQSDLDRSRAWGTFGNASVLAACSALALPVLVGAATRPGPRGQRLLRAAGAIGTTWCLGLAGSRGAVIGAIAGLVALVVARRRLRRPAIVGAVAVLAVSVLVPGTAERVTGRSELAAATASGRLDQWGLTLGLIDDAPLFGSGPETYRIRFPAVADDDFVRLAGDDAIRDRAHNLVLDSLVTIGVLGTAALGWCLVTVVRRRDRTDCRTAGIGAGLVAYLVALQFHFSDPVLDATAWFLAGAIVVVPTSSTRSVALGRRAALAAGLMGAVVIGGLGLRDVVADRRLHGGLDGDPAQVADAAALASDRLLYVQAAGRVALADGEPHTALERADDGLDLAPGDPDLLRDRARALFSLALRNGAFDDALAAWEEIVFESAPSSGRSWLEYGIALAEARRLDEAERAWRRAAELRPDDADPIRNLARLAELRSDPVAARRWWSRVLDRVPDDPEATTAIVGASNGPR